MPETLPFSTAFKPTSSIDSSALSELLATTSNPSRLPPRTFQLENHQKPPAGDWDTWIFLGGRGTGKTIAGAKFVRDHLRQYGHRARVGVMAPTVADARDTCAEGETGLITLFRDEFLSYHRTIGEARHRDGGYVKFTGAEPDRWNGGNWSLLWIDEAALCDPAAIDQADLALRLGPHPRSLWTTTPKGSKWLRLRLSSPGVVVTHATTYDNPHLPAKALERFERRFAHTTLGRQELYAELLDIPEGAIWPMLGLNRDKYLRPMPALYVEADMVGSLQKAPAKPGLKFVRSGAGVDWGTTEQHLATVVSGSVEAQGAIWIRAAWRSASGSSAALIAALQDHKKRIGVSWAAVDRSQWALADWIENSRRDSLGHPIGAGMSALKGDRGVDWRNGLVLSALEQERLFFDANDPGVVEAYEFLTQYHRDSDGKVVEEEDDDADALAYLVAELEHPTVTDWSNLGSWKQTYPNRGKHYGSFPERFRPR